MTKFLKLLKYGLAGLILLLLAYIVYSLLPASTSPTARDTATILVEAGREIDVGWEAHSVLSGFSSLEHPDCASFLAILPRIKKLIDEYEGRSDHDPERLKSMREDYEMIKDKIEFWC